MSDFDSSTPLSDRVLTVRVEPAGYVRLSWDRNLRITGEMARGAMALVDATNAGRERPLLVDMAGTAALTRDARMTFSRRCSASRIALLGSSPVDRVIANFALGVSGVPVPTKFFTSESLAVAWLTDGDVGT
ncbi:hypothetical protein ACQEVB_39985 [Pseudonocardia sp. CA-107938]|uniref:DUF7793 family protein n=1 Tax=Pseudonocardia sp. CA-107938 TaxID=3240021 RepID=UPI003D8BD107